MLTIIILTFNEERHIARCLTAAREIAADIVVVDSLSTDATVALAEQNGARVLAHAFVNYADQFQWALDHADIRTPWVMRLDADEIIEPDLAAEIRARLPTLGPEVAGVNLKRKHIFMGRWLRHGGRYPLVLLRLWRHGQGRLENRWMDEHVVVRGGGLVTFQGGFADCNLNDLTFFTTKHNHYATREAIDVLVRRHGLLPVDAGVATQTSSGQARFRRWMKEKVYYRLPLWCGPSAYVLFRYVLQLGFLDGREGLIYHLLQGFWYRFLVGAKIEEFDRVLRGCPDAASRLAALERLTGHRLRS